MLFQLLFGNVSLLTLIYRLHLHTDDHDEDQPVHPLDNVEVVAEVLELWEVEGAGAGAVSAAAPGLRRLARQHRRRQVAVHHQRVVVHVPSLCTERYRIEYKRTCTHPLHTAVQN